MLAFCQFCVISRTPSTGDLSQPMPSALLCRGSREGPAAGAFFPALVSLLPRRAEKTSSTCSGGTAIGSGTARIAVPFPAANPASVSQRRSVHQTHVNPRGRWWWEPTRGLWSSLPFAAGFLNTRSARTWLCLAKSWKPSRGFPATPGLLTLLQPLSESWS